jgi:FlaA1/EpsC-like NDP-sugar epimerase
MTDMLTRHEEERLLGRPVEALLSAEDRAAFANQVCLITGAGGTVGSELARQIAACGPKRLVLVEQSELALFRIEQALLAATPAVVLDPVLCDVTRAPGIARVMRRTRPDIVFHAAAYKHVTMAERAICAAARVNILGTSATLAASREVGARFVLISTDKAAAPHSVMGATKRLAEQVVLGAYADLRRPIVVRFGNVLASSGSFIEVMRERIRQGQPILLTDPTATRFFMTVSGAASLVMKAATLAVGGETFWLDMGPQVRIGDLAERLLAIARDQGLPPVPIETIGLRPGEKMAEELASQGIRLEKTNDDRVWVAHQARSQTAASDAWLRTLRRAVARDDAYGVMTALTLAIPDFVPSEQAWSLAREAKAQIIATARAARPRPAVVRHLGPRVLPRAAGESRASDTPKLRVVASTPIRGTSWFR